MRKYIYEMLFKSIFSSIKAFLTNIYFMLNLQRERIFPSQTHINITVNIHGIKLLK